VDENQSQQLAQESVETGEKRSWKEKVGDLFGSLTMVFIFGVITLVFWFESPPSSAHRNIVAETLTGWVWAIGPLAAPVLCLICAVVVFWNVYCIATRTTVFQEQQIKRMWKEALTPLWKLVKGIVKWTLIIGGTGIVVLFAYGMGKDFLDKTPGWALVIIALLVLLLIKGRD